MPAAASQLKRVAREAASCTLCPLYRHATQTVFGEGPVGASIMMVVEQPGDQELAEAGLDGKKAYLTNAVKHFKNEPRGKKRLHKRPNRYEVEVCRVWLQKELELVRPQLVLALGVTAAVALAGRPVVLSRERGKVVDFPGGLRGMVTAHPSSILRMPDPAAPHPPLPPLLKTPKPPVNQAPA